MKHLKREGQAIINTNNQAYEKARSLRAKRRREGDLTKQVADLYEVMVMTREEMADVKRRLIQAEKKIASLMSAKKE